VVLPDPDKPVSQMVTGVIWPEGKVVGLTAALELLRHSVDIRFLLLSASSIEPLENGGNMRPYRPRQCAIGLALKK
jgi:hypothetical protein